MKQFYFLPTFMIVSFSFGQNLISPPTFSSESGFYDKEFNLGISHEDLNLKIIYTLDGSEPSIDNLGGKTYQYKKRYPEFPGESPYDSHMNRLVSHSYTDSIRLYNRTKEANKLSNISTSFETNPYFPAENVDKSIVVRAKAYRDDNSFSETVTKVYFINQSYSLPVININVDDDAFFGYENGLFVAGTKFDNWRLNNPSEVATVFSDANYLNRGSSSEVTVNLIYLENSIEQINQTVGIRNHGSGSRIFKNRSHRMYARARYGENRIGYTFFKDYPHDNFRRLILRNSGQDTKQTMFRDAFIQQLNKNLNFDTQNYQPVISFINGEYYGIFNLRERYDERYFQRMYNLRERDIDHIENDGIVDLGDDKFYLKTIDFFKNNSLENQETYQEALTYIDEVNFTDYHIAGIFSANFDWPYNNNESFRKRVNYTPNAPYAHDGRFRWLMKDLDVAFNGAEYWISNSFTHHTLQHAVYPIDHLGKKHVNYILKGLLTNESYKNYFINRFADLLNTTYKTKNVVDLIDAMQNKIRQEMPKHIQRWNLIESMEGWENNVEKLREFARLRPQHQWNHLNEYFNLKGTYELTSEVNDSQKGFIKINTIEINSTTVGIENNFTEWKGDYFKGNEITLETIALPNHKFSHWEGDYTSTNQKITLSPEKDFKVKAVFEDESLSIGDVDKVSFILYPNPVENILNIKSASLSPIEYTISTILGEIVEQSKIYNQQIEVKNLPKGTYVIQLLQDQQKVLKKFIKK